MASGRDDGARLGWLIASPDVLSVSLLAFAVVGLSGFLSAGFMDSVNDFGVHRWPMALIAALLAGGAVFCRFIGEGLAPSRFFCAFLATGAACMARPGVVELGGPYVPLELLLGPLVLLSADDPIIDVAAARSALDALPDDLRRVSVINLSNHDIVSGEGAEQVAHEVLRFAQRVAQRAEPEAEPAPGSAA